SDEGAARSIDRAHRPLLRNLPDHPAQSEDHSDSAQGGKLVKISRILLFLANLARVIPLNPVILVDRTHLTVDGVVATSTRELATKDSFGVRIAKVCAGNDPRGLKS